MKPLYNIHTETGLIEREGEAVTNFEARLPNPQSDLARVSLYFYPPCHPSPGAKMRETNCTKTEGLRNLLFRFQIDATLGAKPLTVQTYGKAKQQHVALIWKWNYISGLPVL